jgi:hypothetical protein
VCCAAAWAVLTIVGGGLSADGVEIGGTVRTTEGRLATGVRVWILSVRADDEGNTNPWCAPDCGKHTVTDQRGMFSFNGLESSARFEVLVEAKGFHPGTTIINPNSNQPLGEVVLVKQTDSPTAATYRVLGRVLQPDGTPAADALVSVQSSQPPSVVEQFVVTGPDGRFVLVSDRHMWRVDVTVRATGAAGGQVYSLKPGAEEHTLQLTTGATVRGRVLSRTRPVPGVKVVARSTHRVMGPRKAIEVVFLAHEQLTGADGCFKFENVAADSELRICTQMQSLAGKNLAAIPQDVRVLANGGELETGDFNLHPAHRVRGRLVTSDGGPLPPGTLASIERRNLSADWQEVRVDEGGNFEFWGVPSETVVLSFHGPGAHLVQGYCLSMKNRSIDRVRQVALCGRVDEDLDLRVLLRPGTGYTYSRGSLPRFDNRNPKRDGLGEELLENQPLFGVSPELDGLWNVEPY